MYFVFDIYYLDLSEERLNATRLEEELNGVVVSAIVAVGGSNTIGPLLGPTHCLLTSLYIGKAVPHSLFLSFSSSFFFFFSLKLIERNLFTRLDVTDVTDKTCFDKVSPTQIVNYGLLCNLDIYIYTDSLSIGKTNCLSLTLIGNFGGNLTKEYRSKSEIDLARL